MHRPDVAPSAPLQFSIDELRRQMDKKHNIRNMSVIAHVDHVSAAAAAWESRSPNIIFRVTGAGGDGAIGCLLVCSLGGRVTVRLMPRVTHRRGRTLLSLTCRFAPMTLRPSFRPLLRPAAPPPHATETKLTKIPNFHFYRARAP